MCVGQTEIFCIKSLPYRRLYIPIGNKRNFLWFSIKSDTENNNNNSWKLAKRRHPVRRDGKGFWDLIKTDLARPIAIL